MAAERKLWLDWQRGFAVLFMIEVHVLDAWLLPAEKSGTAFDVFQGIGGFAAPSFIFMAGLSQVLADAALAAKGVPVGERRKGALRRGLWLFGVAYLFRVVEFILGGAWRAPLGDWPTSLFIVDVLNVIAVSLLMTALIAVGTPRWLHLALAGLGCLFFVGLTPPVAGWEHEPNRLADYLFAVWPRANFHLFNWAGYAFLGSAAGRLAQGRDRPWLWLLAGAALFFGGRAADGLPPFYAHQDFWKTSPSWWAMRAGGVVALSGVLQLLPAAADRIFGPLKTMGRHSLFGYWSSVELTYGIASYPAHRKLPLWATATGMAVMIVSTWALCTALDWRAKRKRVVKAAI
jgi:uncharacterized membrane protein